MNRLRPAVASSVVAPDADRHEYTEEYKEDDSPLTIADKRCNAVIMDYLKGTGIPVISEESKQLRKQAKEELVEAGKIGRVPRGTPTVVRVQRMEQAVQARAPDGVEARVIRTVSSSRIATDLMATAVPDVKNSKP